MLRLFDLAATNDVPGILALSKQNDPSLKSKIIKLVMVNSQGILEGLIKLHLDFNLLFLARALKEKIAAAEPQQPQQKFEPRLLRRGTP